MPLRTFFTVFFAVASGLFAGGAMYQSFVADVSKNHRGAHILYAETLDFSEKSEADFVPLRGVGEPPKTRLSALTGKQRPSSVLDEVVIGVMIDEAIGARTHFTGLESADVFFEIPAEGGIPRILALFSSDYFPESIGPVRSARPYFIEMAEQIAAAYVHAGGSPEALQMLRGSQMANIDEEEEDPRFLRDEEIIRPHNLFVIPEMVLSEISDSTTSYPLFSFGGQFMRDDSVSAQEIDIVYPNSSHSVSYSYSSADDCYARSQYFETADICPNTLLILRTDIWIIENDAKNRLNVRTKGKGDMTLFVNGKKAEGTWQRKEDGRFAFADEGGQEIRISPGKTFVHILGASESVKFSSPTVDEDIRL